MNTRMRAAHAVAFACRISRGAGNLKRRNQKGVAAVEFAIVLPLLLLILFGIIEFSLIMYDKVVITNASREGARAGVVMPLNTTLMAGAPSSIQTQIGTVVDNYCSNYLISFGSATPSVSVPSGAGGAFGTPLTVTVTYKFTGLLLGKMLSPLTGPLTLTATTVMNND